MSNTINVKEKHSTIVTPKNPASSTKHSRHHHKGPGLLTILLSILALIALIHFFLAAHITDATVPIGDCTGLIHSTDYTRLVHLQASQEMDAVQFVNSLAGGQPAALVSVTNAGSQNSLDVYVYGCTVQQHTPNLNTLFTQRGLIQGTVAISSQNTLITSELDPLASPQDSTIEQPLQQNIYREYAWRNGAFVQIAFPSLYPVVSRGEAEALQQQADTGQTLPWSDPFTTAEQMAKDLLNWPGNNPQATVLSNDGTTAQVKLVQQNPALEITVTLKRLIEQNSTGLWFVVSAQTAGITLKSAGQASQSTSSSITFQGTGLLADGQTTTTLFDHTLTPLTLNGISLSVDGTGVYSGTLSYGQITPGQQGILLIQSLPLAGSTEVGELLLAGVILG